MNDTLNTPDSAKAPEGASTSDNAPEGASPPDSAVTSDSSPDSPNDLNTLILPDTLPAPDATSPTMPLPTAYRATTLYVGDPSIRSLADTKPPTPRIRIGAIVWGVIVSALAVAFLLATSTTGRRIRVADWMNGLNAETLALLGLLAVGVFIVLLALVSAVHRAQRRAAR